MDAHTDTSPQEPKGPEIEFKYIVDIRTLETFANQMGRQGVIIPRESLRASFYSPKRLEMRAYKDRGLIWSYSIISVSKTEERIEEG